MKDKEILKITIMQFDTIQENPEENKNKIFALAKKIIEDTDIIILPELFTTGFTMNVEKFSETMKGNTIKWMKEMSREFRSAICGSIIIEEDKTSNYNSRLSSHKKKKLYFNRFIWVNPSGKKYYYDKRHLFSFVGENKYFTAGDRRVIINYKGWKILPLICYDLRFPVWSRYKGDYDFIIYVANWPQRRSYAWKHLLVARAIENQSFVVGVNRIGYDNNGVYHSGDSCLIEPDGKIAFLQSDIEAVKTLEINKRELYNFRKRYPFLKDRLYEYLK